jgi:hypothetical protein
MTAAPILATLSKVRQTTMEMHSHGSSGASHHGGGLMLTFSQKHSPKNRLSLMRRKSHETIPRSITKAL